MSLQEFHRNLGSGLLIGRQKPQESLSPKLDAPTSRVAAPTPCGGTNLSPNSYATPMPAEIRAQNRIPKQKSPLHLFAPYY
jgi:hypothetical protein